MKRFAIASVIAFAAMSNPALARGLQPGETAPTPDLLARARRTIPPAEGDRPDYHFRTSGGIIWVCSYNGVGNGGFCTRTPLSDVKRIDDLAEGACQHGGPGAIVPHALSGEAIVLNYDCKGGHMLREPYAQHFDADGWMLDEWKPLQ